MMNKLEIKRMINEAIDQRHQIHITRINIDENPIDCIPIAAGKKLLLVEYLYDFLFDGYLVIRINDITSIRSGEIERYSEHIFNSEGIVNHNKLSTIEFDDNWDNIFRWLQSLNEFCIIECESLSSSSNFYIGKIENIRKDSVDLLNFNAIGKWDKHHTNILYEHITLVSFKTRYIDIMRKYLQ